MKKLTYFALALVSISLFSCGGKSEADLNAEVDSLRTALTQRDADYQQLDEFLAVVSTGLDSIAMQENALFNPGKESPVPNQATIKAQLAQFKETLKTQRERITELEKQLKEGKGNAKQMQLIITTLKAQMEESFKNQEENVHKENVRVYRNVQASLIEELKQQSEAIDIQHLHIEKKIKGIKPCAIIGIVFSCMTLKFKRLSTGLYLFMGWMSLFLAWVFWGCIYV